MNLRLLIDQDEFEIWKKRFISTYDTAKNPTEFPCYARTVVQSWGGEEVCAVYLYLDDVKNMLTDMNTTKNI